MIRTQRWMPDTCDCVVEETYDPDNPAFEWFISQVFSKCADHAAIADNGLYNILYKNADSEQKRKNNAHKFLTETDTLNLNQTLTNDSGQTYKQFKNGVDWTWKFSGTGSSRVLEISVTGATLTNNQKNTIQNFCDTTFGVGKVKLI